jgi:hypothetical protein
MQSFVTLRSKQGWGSTYMLSTLLFIQATSCIHAFTCSPLRSQAAITIHHKQSTHRSASSSRLHVRNIDLPECLIFYGQESFIPDDGLESLLKECKDIDTAVVLIRACAGADTKALEQDTGAIKNNINNNNKNIVKRCQDCVSMVYNSQVQPPNPYDLLNIVQTLTVQPRPFGGSAGFGSKLPDPPRSPLPARCVVIATTMDQTRAGRLAGMRVVSYCQEDQSLADAIIDCVDFSIDDIATPGSFWLNPPQPRDDDGNKVDPDYWLSMGPSAVSSAEDEQEVYSFDIEDEATLLRLLADIDPL